MPTLHVPLLIQFENRSSSLDKDSKSINNYGEMESKEKALTIKRPGYGSGVLYEAATAQGVVNYLGVLRAVLNNKFYKTSATSVAVDTAGAVVDFA